jgi:dienelactone hydrolase
MLTVLGLASSVIAAPPQTRLEKTKPDDQRLKGLRSTDGSTFPMRPITKAADWPARRDETRMRILVAAGLHPFPKRSPLNPVIHGKVERDDYTIERVIFESFPGHYVTGSLYRPKAPAKGKRPAILCPYGHWKEGRFHDHGDERLRKEIASGAERFEVGGRHVIQARCVQLARMGCIVFVYDMEGFADSVQLEHRLGPRPQAADSSGYLLHSPQAELHGQTPFGLQTWNSIRSLDFIHTIEDVDPKRIAITGGSGGGTQSMILSAIDPRIAAAMPAVMVSSGGQGGCTCENAQFLRIGQGNVDIAAATAPRPLGLICANDWTKALKASGHTELKALYKTLGYPRHYEAHFHFEFGHNYNSVNRQHMYHFMNRHLKLGLHEPIQERDYLPLDPAKEASVWIGNYPKPDGAQIGETHERKLTAEWAKATDAGLKETSTKYRSRVMAQGLAVMIGRTPDDVGPIAWKEVSKVDVDDHLIRVGRLNVTEHGEQLPVRLIYPKNKWNRQIVVWLDETGKDTVLGKANQPTRAVAALLGMGYGVASIDLFGQGEFVDGGKAIESVRLIFRGKGTRPGQKAACYHFGYNPPLLVQRVHDVMSLVEYLRQGDGKRKAKHIHLAAIGKQAGTVGLAARSMLGNHIDKAVIDVQGFTFDSVDRIDHPMFLPGILRYGGMEALWVLSRPFGAAKVKGADAVPNGLKNLP